LLHVDFSITIAQQTVQDLRDMPMVLLIITQSLQAVKLTVAVAGPLSEMQLVQKPETTGSTPRFEHGYSIQSDLRTGCIVLKGCNDAEVSRHASACNGSTKVPRPDIYFKWTLPGTVQACRLSPADIIWAPERSGADGEESRESMRPPSMCLSRLCVPQLSTKSSRSQHVRNSKPGASKHISIFPGFLLSDRAFIAL
jgi:hypothetical protein